MDDVQPPDQAHSNDREAAPPVRFSKFGQGGAALLAIAATYILSGGPVMAGCCWLRETTGRDEFYAVFWLYYPLLIADFEPLGRYVEWWFQLFGTVGPG